MGDGEDAVEVIHLLLFYPIFKNTFSFTQKRGKNKIFSNEK